MKILLDHNVPRPLRRHLPGHDVRTTRQERWDDLDNGVLLRAAADGGFKLLLTVDKKMEHEQNLRLLPVPIVMLDTLSNKLPNLLPLMPAALVLLATPLAPALYIVAADGSVLRLNDPRPKR